MSALSAELLAKFRQRYGLAAFVETGCYMGDGIAAALAAGFEQVRSCDIAESHAGHCQNRFAGDDRVQILLADSLGALASILQEDLGPALFWLDAHYPAFYGLKALETETTRFPAVREMELIHQQRQGAARDVIMVDDVRVLNAGDNPRWRPGEVSEYYRVDGLTLAGVTAPFRQTHDVRIEEAQEGLLLLTPRSSG